MSTHRQLPPRLCVPGGPTDGSRSITPYAPGVGAPDQRFLLPTFSPLSRAGLVSHMAQAVHDANDPASACGIDGLHEFLVFPLATSTRTSLVSFEPFLPLLTCRCSSLFILLFYGLTGARVRPGQFQRALAQWYSVDGSLDLLSRWGGVQLVDSADDLYCGRFQVRRFCGSSLVVEEQIPAEIEETSQSVEGIRACSSSSMDWTPCRTSLVSQTCWTNNNVETVVW